VAGGQPTAFGEWPHVCSILRNSGLQNHLGQPMLDYVCMASLLRSNAVLTAAHCVRHFVKTPDELEVRCGDWDITGEGFANEVYEHQQIKVAKVVLHPHFRQRELTWQSQWDGVGEVVWDGVGYVDDQAVLFLKEDFQLGEHIGPICLPDSTSDYNEEECFVSGYGKNGSGVYQTTLQTAQVSLLDRKTCLQQLKEASGSKSTFSLNLQESSVCSAGGADLGGSGSGGAELGGSGADLGGSCEGDDGGALVCASFDNPQTFVQAGIVSWRAGRTSCVDDGRDLQGDRDSASKQGLRVHSGVAANSCWIRGVLQCNLSSQSCLSNVARSCADCKKDFKKNTSLSGHRVRGRRTKARSLAACWLRCKEKPDCRFVNWVKEHPSQSKRKQCTLLRSRGSARREKGIVSGSGC